MKEMSRRRQQMIVDRIWRRGSIDAGRGSEDKADLCV